MSEWLTNAYNKALNYSIDGRVGGVVSQGLSHFGKAYRYSKSVVFDTFVSSGVNQTKAGVAAGKFGLSSFFGLKSAFDSVKHFQDMMAARSNRGNYAGSFAYSLMQFGVSALSAAYLLLPVIGQFWKPAKAATAVLGVLPKTIGYCCSRLFGAGAKAAATAVRAGKSAAAVKTAAHTAAVTASQGASHGTFVLGLMGADIGLEAYKNISMGNSWVNKFLVYGDKRLLHRDNLTMNDAGESVTLAGFQSFKDIDESWFGIKRTRTHNNYDGMMADKDSLRKFMDTNHQLNQVT